MFRNNLLRQGIVRIERFNLQQQAFPQIARTHANGIEILHHGNRVVEIVLRIFSALRQFLHGCGQIPVFIQVADDALGQLFHRIGADGYTELPGGRWARTKTFRTKAARKLRALAICRRRRRYPGTD